MKRPFYFGKKRMGRGEDVIFSLPANALEENTAPPFTQCSGAKARVKLTKLGLSPLAQTVNFTGKPELSGF